MSGSAAPLLSPKGALLALAAALLLGWPMLVTGGYLFFADSESYIRGGEIVWDMAIDMLETVLPATGGGAAGGGAAEAAAPVQTAAELVNERGEARVMRSFVYSLYTLATGAALWPAGFALLQAAMTLWMLFALIGPEAARRPAVLLAGFAYLALLTTLPWFASYLMPDLLAAAVVVYGAILMRRFDVLGPVQRLCLGALAAFAIVAHYGHVPLAAGLFAGVLGWRLLQGRLTAAVVLAAVLPVLFAPLANIGASTVALDKPSATPLRLPILLARSIDDGPARWYIEEQCPEVDLAICEIFADGVPRRISQFLWGEGGIDSMTPDQLDRIREEEATILWRAFKAYPVAQSTSLFGNATKQLFEVGLDGIRVGVRTPDGGLERAGDPARSRAAILAIEPVVVIATYAGAAVIAALLLSGRLRIGDVELVVAVVAGLLLNAAIFGGLSAPAERYQSRVVWLLPALALLFLAEGRWAAASWRAARARQ